MDFAGFTPAGWACGDSKYLLSLCYWLYSDPSNPACMQGQWREKKIPFNGRKPLAEVEWVRAAEWGLKETEADIQNEHKSTDPMWDKGKLNSIGDSIQERNC